MTKTRWFRVNTVNEAGKPSSATVGKRLTQSYMLLVKGKKRPSDEDMKSELTRIAKESKTDKTFGGHINTTDKFTEYLLKSIEKAVLKKD